jgi:hypothetical protein
MNGWVARRAIVAATQRHVTIVDYSTRIDIELRKSFIPEALCHALQGGIQDFAALTGEDCSELGDHLCVLGLVEAEPQEGAHVLGTIPLARALRQADGSLAKSSVIYTADEAFWPGSDPHLARLGFRLFVSRLAGIARCAIYALLASGEDVCVVGDEPPATALEDTHQAAKALGGPCVVDLHSGEMTGVLGDISDAWTGQGRRLSVAQCTYRENWQISSKKSITWVSGVSAFSNLSALPLLHQVSEFRELDFQWVSGVDADPEIAKVKCLAEGAERFLAGDVDPRCMQYSAAFELPGLWLDPRRIIAFSSAQRNRLGISEFDAKIPEWWVSGRCQNGPIWIPAALVFYPFVQTPVWLTTFAVSSNGVAAYKTADGALRRAWLELVERDAFQRARLTGRIKPPPQICVSKLPDDAREMVAHMAQYAEVRVLLLPSPTGIPVALVRADTDQTMAIGTAAAGDLGQSVMKAATEAFLQITHPFLKDIRPESVVSPHDHAALYNTPEWREKLNWMSQGYVIDPAETCSSSRSDMGPNVCWYEFPAGLSDLHVVRALDPDLIPLTFGYDADPVGRDDVSALLRLSSHPEDRPLDPHAFA